MDWSLPAQELAWRVRGLRPWPGAYTTFRGKNLHVWAAVALPAEAASPLEPGTLVAERGKLHVVCGQGTRLEIKELQVEGRKRLSAYEFLNGVHLKPGERLG